MNSCTLDKSVSALMSSVLVSFVLLLVTLADPITELCAMEFTFTVSVETKVSFTFSTSSLSVLSAIPFVATVRVEFVAALSVDALGLEAAGVVSIGADTEPSLTASGNSAFKFALSSSIKDLLSSLGKFEASTFLFNAAASSFNFWFKL